MSWAIGIHVNGIHFENAEWNYTHNCNDMMREAGYDWVYRLDGQKVVETLPKFRAMLTELEAHPKKYRAMNPPNGWGDYDRLCKKLHEIMVRASEIVESVPDAQWWEWS
jgi:hypothetical protein